VFEGIHDGNVRGFLHVAPRSKGGVVLAHGAGGNAANPLLIAAAKALCEASWTVLRYDLPFRQLRERGAPHPSRAARDREGLAEAAAWLRTKTDGPIVIGGQSYGGRQASMLTAEQPPVASALVLLSYPLHPPGQPQKLRTAHLPSIHTPCLFVHGTKDPFGTIAEIEAAMALIPARKTLAIVDGAGHDLARGRFDIVTKIVAPLTELL
jgi:uncharacterized protein